MPLFLSCTEKKCLGFIKIKNKIRDNSWRFILKNCIVNKTDKFLFYNVYLKLFNVVEYCYFFFYIPTSTCNLFQNNFIKKNV